MDKNLIIGLLAFAVAVLQLLSQQAFVPPAWLPYILALAGILNVIISTWGASVVRRLRGK